MNDWLEKFYNDPDLRATLLRSFLPAFSNYVSEATGGPVAASFVQALAESYVDRHLGSSRAQLQEVIKGSDDPLAALTQRFTEWEEKRPGKVAKNELIRSANAAQVEQMREAGVTKMVWRASGGDTCPFCRELDGVIISVDGTFFKEGDTLNPEGVEHPINFESSLGHPPVHQGCVCSVEAVTETETANFDAQPLPDVDDHAYKEIEAWEDSVVSKPFEHGMLIDRNGNLVEEATQGHETAVGFSESVRGNILTHNHPSNLSFSVEDIKVGANGALEVRAVTESYRHVMQPPAGGWPSARRISTVHKVHETAVDKERMVVRSSIWENSALSDAEKIAQTKALSEDRAHWIWERAAPELGLVYQRVPRGGG